MKFYHHVWIVGLILASLTTAQIDPNIEQIQTTLLSLDDTPYKPIIIAYILSSASNPKLSESDLFTLTQNAPFPLDKTLANKIMPLFSIAFGRVLLEELGVTINLSDYYIEFDKYGKVITQGLLKDNSAYKEIKETARRLKEFEVFITVATLSEEVVAYIEVSEQGLLVNEFAPVAILPIEGLINDKAFQRMDTYLQTFLNQ